MSDKDTEISMGKKEGGFSVKEIIHKTTTAGLEYLNYNKKYRAEKVSDKTGWSVREENKSMFKKGS